MKKQPTTRDERKIRFAEAGILFVLVLALTIFAGVRMARHAHLDDIVGVAEVITEAESPVADTTPVDNGNFLASAADSTGIVAEIVPVESETIVLENVTYAMAEQTYFDGDYAAAADLFDAYTADHAANAWGFFMLGLSEWKAGDLDASEEAFIGALDLKPDHIKSLINYGRVLLEAERYGEARAQVERALLIVPENIDANRTYSRICHNEGRLTEAADSYLKVLRLQEDDVWSLNNLGLIRIQQGLYADAVAPLAKAAQLNSGIACIQNNLGLALERTGHYTAAVDAFEMALAADAGYAKADESLDRVSGLTEATDLASIDLVAMAAGFSAHAAVAVTEAPLNETPLDEVPVDEVTEVPGDMEVASTVEPTEVNEDPPRDEPQDQ